MDFKNGLPVAGSVFGFPRFSSMQSYTLNQHGRLVSTHPLSELVPVVTTPFDAWRALARPNTLGVILARDHSYLSEQFRGISNVALKAHGRHRGRLHVGYEDSGMSAHFLVELAACGFTAEHRELQHNLVVDITWVRTLTALFTGQDYLWTGIGSSWIDERGLHIDNGDSLAALVTYDGPGTAFIDPEQLSPECYERALSLTPMYLSVKPGTIAVVTRTFDILWMKCKKFIGQPVSLANLGLPHCTVDPNDPEFGFEKRMTSVMWGEESSYQPTIPDLRNLLQRVPTQTLKQAGLFLGHHGGH